MLKYLGIFPRSWGVKRWHDKYFKHTQQYIELPYRLPSITRIQGVDIRLRKFFFIFQWCFNKKKSSKEFQKIIYTYSNSPGSTSLEKRGLKIPPRFLYPKKSIFWTLMTHYLRITTNAEKFEIWSFYYHLCTLYMFLDLIGL